VSCTNSGYRWVKTSERDRKNTGNSIGINADRHCSRRERLRTRSALVTSTYARQLAMTEAWHHSNHTLCSAHKHAVSVVSHDCCFVTCEQEASPTRKYSVNRQATNISRFLPIIGYSSLRAVMMASEPPNCGANKRF
jgi:hypothetical protein